MGVVTDVTFEVARRGLGPLLREAMSRLDLRGRARLLRALDQPGQLDGIAPLSLHRRFLEDRPIVDREEVQPLVGAVLDHLSMEDALPELARLLDHVALLDGRMRWGWPEIAMLEALLLEAGAPAAPDVLRDRLLTEAERVSALVTGASQLDTAERERRVGRTDEQGRPLYRGLDGEATTQPSVEVPTRDAGYAALYRAPPEMARDPLRRGYAEDELWRRHFARLPDGAVRCAAWLRDPVNHLTTRQLLPALDEAEPPDPERLLHRYCDAVLIERLATLLSRRTRSLLSLDDGADAESIFVALAHTSTLRADLRRAALLLDRAHAQITSIVAALRETLGVTERPELDDEARSRALVDELSVSELMTVARELGPALPLRLGVAHAIHLWLAQPGARSLVVEGIHPALLDAANQLGPTIPPGASASVLRSILRAQRMLERGSAAFEAVGQGGEDSRAAASELAVELAVSALLRNLRDAAPSSEVSARDYDRIALAERFDMIAQALAAQIASERDQSRQQLDAQDRPLFVGAHGVPTVESTAFELMRGVEHDVLFAAPDDPEAALPRATLWEEHFVHKPHGDRAFEAWIRDIRNVRYRRKGLPPWLVSGLSDPQRLAKRTADASWVVGQIDALAGSAPETLALDALPGRRMLVELLPDLALDRAEPAELMEIPWFESDLLRVASRHRARSLPVRLRTIVTLRSWWERAHPRPALEVALHPAIREVLVEAAHKLPQRRLDGFVVALLFNSEAILERARGVDGAEEAALDFAVQGLRSALDRLAG